MSLQCTGLSLLPFSQSVYTKENVIKASLSFDKLRFTSICLPRSPFLAGNLRKSCLRASKVELLDCDDEKEGVEKSNNSDDDGDGDFEMDEDEMKELRKKIRQIVEMNPEVKEEVDPEERKKKMQKLLTDYSLVVDEEDPNWPEDADGWGFNFSQFFDKMSIKNVKKDDDDDDDSENEVNWQDIRAVKDITAAEWEETVFSDLSPLVVLVHNRYRRSYGIAGYHRQGVSPLMLLSSVILCRHWEFLSFLSSYLQKLGRSYTVKKKQEQQMSCQRVWPSFTLEQQSHLALIPL